MQYLITNLWKLPNLTQPSRAQEDQGEEASGDKLLAAACRDCGQYNFPPKGQCRYCGSPRIRTVSLSSEQPANPGTWVFGAASSKKKPN